MKIIRAVEMPQPKFVLAHRISPRDSRATKIGAARKAAPMKFGKTPAGI
jgi:hypothetical protein